MKLIDTLENHRPVENRFLCKVEGQPDIWAQPRAIIWLFAQRDTSSCTVITVSRPVCQNEVISWGLEIRGQ